MEKRKNNIDRFDHEITIDRVACPIHVLQMKTGIKRISSGETLKVKSTAYAIPELLSAARQLSASVFTNDNNELFLVKA